MEGFKLKNRVLPISSSTEAELVLSIIDELRTNLALEIDPAPSFDRAMKAGPNENKRALQYLVLGNYKADKLTEGLKSSGVTAEAVTLEDWRANPISIGLMLDKVKLALTEVRPETLVLIGLESSFYQAQTEDGFTMPVKKTTDGHYHVEGELVLCTREVQIKHFKTMEPLWQLSEHFKMIIIAPLPEYIIGGCCQGSGHVANRGLPNFEAKLRSGLDGVKQNMKMYLHSGGLSKCMVLDPWIDIKGLTNEQIWVSPTCPSDEVYLRLAAGIKAVEARLPAKRTASATPVQEPVAKKQREGPGDQPREAAPLRAQERGRGPGRNVGRGHPRGGGQNESRRSRGARSWRGRWAHGGADMGGQRRGWGSGRGHGHGYGGRRGSSRGYY
jgi:hypothetical protein